MLIQTDLFQWAEKENHILPLNMTQEKNLRERNILDGCQKFKIKMFNDLTSSLDISSTVL